MFKPAGIDLFQKNNWKQIGQSGKKGNLIAAGESSNENKFSIVMIS
jgi:hypothetical protein